MPKTFPFGPLKIDVVDYASRASGVLGIRDSGKSYTATYIAEQLHAAGIPFIAFDPSGVWKWLRVPGKGKGLPVVVAGGKAADIPINGATAPAIIEAAMKGGVSLVVDLSGDMSKAEWRQIVQRSVKTLLQKNEEYGLRHVFLEEAAEFVPQRPFDGETFAAVEKLVRVGGNARLGATIINQRAAEVAKSVLELCDNLFLHRQRGKNSIESLSKWLDVAEVEEWQAIVKSLSGLPTGECWAWLAGDLVAHRIKVPAKASLHPDRRVTLEGAGKLPETKKVDVGQFVEAMRASLGKIEEQLKADDPKVLRARIAELERAAKMPVPTTAVISEKDRRALIDEGSDLGFVAGRTVGLNEAIEHLEKILPRFEAIFLEIAGLTSRLAVERDTTPKRIPRVAHPRNGDARPPALKPGNSLEASRVSLASGDQVQSGPETRILDAIAWWAPLIGSQPPSKTQVAFVAGYAPNTGTFNTYLSRLRSKGMIDYRDGGVILLEGGDALASRPDALPTWELVHRAVLGKIDGPLTRIMSPLLNISGEDPGVMSREALAGEAGYAANTGTFNTYLSRLKSLGLIDYPSKGFVAPAGWLFP